MLGTELLRGQNVRLAALTAADAPTIASWYEDAAFLRFWDSAIAMPKTAQEIVQWIEEARKAGRDLLLALRRLADGELIGLACFDGVQWNNGAAFLGIALGPAHWDQGYGTEALRLLLRYAFLELNLHRVGLTVFEYNARALAVYRKLGFQREGTIREVVHRDGRRYDMYFMGLLQREWRGLQEAETRVGASGALDGAPL